MGMYINIGNDGFAAIRKGLYVDKSGLIAYINKTLGTRDKLVCASRPRRFGKSYTTQMLSAYYDKRYDSHKLFCDLKIAGDSSYKKHLTEPLSTKDGSGSVKCFFWGAKRNMYLLNIC